MVNLYLQWYVLVLQVLMLKCMEIKFRFFFFLHAMSVMLEEKLKLFCMCVDELSTPMEPQAWPSTDPAGTRSSTDSDVLTGVAVFVIMLVLAAACNVVLFIWWR